LLEELRFERPNPSFQPQVEEQQPPQELLVLAVLQAQCCVT